MKDLLQKLESYNWTDELGHPLANCVEWELLKKNIASMKKLVKHLRKNDPKWPMNVEKMLSKQKVKDLSDFVYSPKPLTGKVSKRFSK